MSAEETTPINVDDNQQYNIYFNEADNDSKTANTDTTNNIETIDTDPNIQRDDDETNNLIHTEHVSEIDDNTSADNNNINDEPHTINIEQLQMDSNDEEEKVNDNEPLSRHTPSPIDIDIDHAQIPTQQSNYLTSNVSMCSVDSIGSEPTMTNKTIKAIVMCTFVPKYNSGSELTVIAGDVVTVLHSEPITLIDNPLALVNSVSGEIDKIIILNSMHWTHIQSRSGRTGVVPSNILKYISDYEDNPIYDVWTKVKIQHSYMAKSQDQLTISANEKIQIYGIVTDDGMIIAKRKDESQGLIPYDFVEIPAAQVDTANNRKDSISSIDATVYEETERTSVSLDHSMGDGVHRRVYTGTSTGTNGLSEKRTPISEQRASLKFVIDDMKVTANTGDMQTISEHTFDGNDKRHRKKNTLTFKIKKFSSSLSKTIDKIQYGAYSQRATSKTLEVIHVSGNLSTSSGNASDNMMSDSTNDTGNEIGTGNTSAAYHWDAPLNWKKVYVEKDFNATHEEIERVYEIYVTDRETRGRVGSMLSYITDPESEVMENDIDVYDAAVPSRRKKTGKDALQCTTSDMIEITGDPSPEGWVLARFVHDKEHKGFVPISHLQIESKPNTTKQSMTEADLFHGNDVFQQPLASVDENSYDEAHDRTIVTQSQSNKALENETTEHQSPSASRPNPPYIGEMNSPLNQSLPVHWPFSSYPIDKRTKRSKVIESVVLFVLLLIYVLPIIIEHPVQHTYFVWWVNLLLVCLPWLGIVTLRMLEIWTDRVSLQDNPNNRLYATLLFYIVLIVYFFGLFAIIIATLSAYKWIRDNSPVLFLATIVEIIVFMCCATIIVSSIVFILIWTFCCRISRNRWETRIEFYCCTKGDAVRTKRYPRKK